MTRKGLLEDQPDHPDALRLLGLLKHQAGDNETAERMVGDRSPWIRTTRRTMTTWAAS